MSNILTKRIIHLMHALRYHTISLFPTKLVLKLLATDQEKNLLEFFKGFNSSDNFVLTTECVYARDSLVTIDDYQSDILHVKKFSGGDTYFPCYGLVVNYLMDNTVVRMDAYVYPDSIRITEIVAVKNAVTAQLQVTPCIFNYIKNRYNKTLKRVATEYKQQKQREFAEQNARNDSRVNDIITRLKNVDQTKPTKIG